ncbi:MAG: histidinol-phosphate transaminase [Bacteroidetes bacterium]|nr:histidinol-phosphate transaminase [Bacteroidota bacterium]
MSSASTTSAIDAMVRPSIRALEPYRAARHDNSAGILLDANENPYASAGEPALNRYPDPRQNRLRARLAGLVGVRQENVFVGVGSDEAIDLLMRIFCEPARDAILVAEPTYGMYRVAAALNNIAVRGVPLVQGTFGLDLPAMLSAVEERTRLIFCCSPNNPTGNLLAVDDLLALCERSGCIVVVDEAYIEFASRGSMAALVNDIPNLVVLRTLSKAWGLAGLRLGYAVAQPGIVSWLMNVKPPYNVGSLVACTALAALEDVGRERAQVAAIVAERERLAAGLAKLRGVLCVHPSDANFLLVRFANAAAVHAELRERGLIVRDRSGEPGLAGALRITVGTPAENTALLNALLEIDA